MAWADLVMKVGNGLRFSSGTFVRIPTAWVFEGGQLLRPNSSGSVRDALSDMGSLRSEGLALLARAAPLISRR